ncbi:hypothetical protein [Bdellovibrio sp.]|uniref:hypothetical protein n=1 Tax=Bdellovibrio TaxID=958 RepID=UPI003221A450|nr:hypothetical protein CKG001_00690 [Bdellovibrio sp. CKG001]BFD61389.1 hypothetical protein BdHM001_00700 [Bdellovibrio sp. HM001]BFD65048.1 hypothetical protein HAGR004_00700 [Bdellovibrio sp. HAGR004]
MGIGDKMRGLASSAQEGVKSSTISLFHILLRLVTGLVLGLTLALIGQELMGYGTFALLFVMVVVVAALMKILANWSIGQILIFDLICVLVVMLLRMYILVAP